MKLELSLSQKQSLSQQMQLSVRILQMNTPDLEQYIRESALENPLIELELPPETDDPRLTRLKKLEWLASMDENGSYLHVPRPDDSEPGIPLYERSPGDSLSDVLLAQLPGFRLSPEDERVARYLIGSLDENGYLTAQPEHLLEELHCGRQSLEQALDALKRMEPPGVGASGLKECLLIQARRMENAGPLLIPIIEQYLELLAKNQLARIAKSLGVSVDEVKEARSRLLMLNPKPGNGYSSYKSIPYISPDLFIVRFESGFHVILNDYNQPRPEINGSYRQMAVGADPETAAYILDRLDKAEWLISCVRQRGDTVLRCARSILERQLRFFEHGPGNLVSMTLADVAGDVGLHPSTVSRAVRGKYLQCQWGVFGLAELFSRNSGGVSEESSRDMVLGRIKSIISGEDPAKPYSDREIASLLEKSGMPVARRTVAKYREQMGLPPAGGRKKY